MIVAGQFSKYEEIPTWAKNLYSQTKARAKKRGNEFNLTKDYYASIISDRCAITGVAFETWEVEERHYKRPFYPSIDRIDSERGYEDDNVRLICVAANLAMNSWGYDVLLKMAAGMVMQERDNSLWRRAAGKLPEGVKIVSSGRSGFRYMARARVNGERKYLGCFGTQEEACSAIAAAKKAENLVDKIPPL